MAENLPRRPIVGVMGSGSREHADLAEPLGIWLAEAGVHILTGGGGGVMAAVSRAFHGVRGRAGVVIGVLPGRASPSGHESPAGYPNPWVELPIHTHLDLSGPRGGEAMSRNHINVLSSHAVIALPGGAGTASEVRLARRYRKPLLAFLGDGGVIEGLRRDELAVARSLGEVRAFIRGTLSAIPGMTFDPPRQLRER